MKGLTRLKYLHKCIKFKPKPWLSPLVNTGSSDYYRRSSEKSTLDNFKNNSKFGEHHKSKLGLTLYKSEAGIALKIPCVDTTVGNLNGGIHVT